MSKVILFNGPPGCGKDAAAELCRTKLGFVHAKMADPLKDGLAGFFGVSRQFLEENKENECVDGLTWRQVLISFSEDWMKPKLGKDIMGRVALLRLKQLPLWRNIAISDSGFENEVLPWIREFNAQNILLVRIHRPGHNFSGDSRTYLDLSMRGINAIDLSNDGTLHEFLDKVMSVAGVFVADRNVA